MDEFRIEGLDDDTNALFAAAFKAAGISQHPGAEPAPNYVRDGMGDPIVSDEPIKPGEALQNSGIKAEDSGVLVPHLTQEELERNTPSRGKKMVAVKPPAGVSVQTFYLLLSNTYALYVLNGAYNNEDLQVRTGVAPGTIATVLSSAEFKYALRLRGIEPNATGLTTEQDYALLTLTDPSDGKTLPQKLRALGLSYAKYRAWLKQPAFRMQMEKMTGDLLHNNIDSLVQLESLANQGDLGAIKYKHELNGLYDPNKQNNIDAMALMSLIFEVVARNVKDPVALEGVGKELGEIAQQLKLEPKQIGQ